MTYATAIHALVDRGRLAGRADLAGAWRGRRRRHRRGRDRQGARRASHRGGLFGGEGAKPRARPGPMRRSSIRRAVRHAMARRRCRQLFKDAVGPGGRRCHPRSRRRRLYRAGAAQHRLGRAVPGRRLSRPGIAKLPLNLTLLKSCDVCGVFWGAFAARDPQANAAHVEQLFRWWDEGKIAPKISATYPLERAGEAIAALRDRKRGRQAGGDALSLADWRASRSARAIFWAAACFAFVMAVVPHPPEMPGEPNDKVQHIVAFATLAAAWQLCLSRRPRLSQLLLGLSLFGALDRGRPGDPRAAPRQRRARLARRHRRGDRRAAARALVARSGD